MLNIVFYSARFIYFRVFRNRLSLPGFRGLEKVHGKRVSGINFPQTSKKLFDKFQSLVHA